MDINELIYYPFMELKGKVSSTADENLKRELKGFSGALERFDVDVIIHDDWIIKIENTTKFIENAILENRQFIREDGEVIPIEKVKHVNKASVTNLAKHSEYITHVPEDGSDVIPDKLYTVEKETDFSIYENRFLYLLLVTLREFISLQKEEITTIIESGYTKLDIKKSTKISNTDNKITVNVIGKQARGNVDLASKLERINYIEGAVDSLIGMNLMVEMSKFPLISKTITKTNVLRMNENFKACLELYEFITKYEDEGFDTVSKKSRIELSDDEKLELEISLLTLEVLAYKDSNELTDEFIRKYKSYLATLDDEARLKRDERIKELKKQLKEKEEVKIDYILLLEDKITDLLKLNDEIDSLRRQNDSLQETVARLNDTIKAKDNEIVEITKSKQAIEDSLKNSFEKNNELKDVINSLKEEKSYLETEKKSLQAMAISKDERIKDLGVEIEGLKDELNKSNDNIESIKLDHEAEINALNEQISELRMKLLSHGERSLDDYTTKEGFDELEREYNMISKIYKEEWKKTKKRIKKELKEEK